MNVLIVGGTGLTGATTANYLRGKGHNITLMARNRPANPALRDYPFIACNYMDDDLDVAALSGFDWLVFAAGADIRMLPEGETPASFFERANSRGIPAFFAAAKQAGIRRAAYLGTYYPQVVPEKIATDPYVKSRHEADSAIRAMSCDTFNVCCVNAPFIIGAFPGVVDAHLAAMVLYAGGQIDGLPVVAADGGVVHITASSLAQALEGALERGESGRAYLVGDAYMSWKDYIEHFCAALKTPRDLQVSREEHPMLPDMILYAGRNAVVDYTPDNTPLNYATGQVPAAIVEVVETYAAMQHDS